MIKLEISRQPERSFKIQATCPEEVVASLNTGASSFMYYGKGYFDTPDDAVEGLYQSVTLIKGLFASASLIRFIKLLPRAAAIYLCQSKKEKFKEEAFVPYPVEVWVDGVYYPEVEELETTLMGENTELNLGTFKLDSAELLAIDPCYDNMNSGITFAALPGLWSASVVVGPSSWNLRHKQLRVWTDGFDVAQFSNVDNFKELDGYAGVDSGQCGFFEKARYPTEQAQFEYDGETFYGRCCDKTNDNTSEALGAGVISDGFGVLSQSGYGDGGYSVYVSTNKNGVAVAAVLLFISENENEGD